MIALFIIACSVAADATAVSIAAAVRGATFRRGMSLACTFGIAQAVMAGIGWYGGEAVGSFWAAWDHWIALILLCVVGARMIKEAFEPPDARAAVGGLSSLLILAIATSLDALAVGVSLPTLGVTAFLSLAMIGGITFLFSSAGVAFGRYLGERFGRTMEVAGGVALILIGIKIVFDHTR